MAETSQFQNLYEGFSKAAKAHPGSPALWVDGQSHSYADLEAYAVRLASAILANEKRAVLLAAVMGYRSFSSYAAVLGEGLCAPESHLPARAPAPHAHS